MIIKHIVGSSVHRSRHGCVQIGDGNILAVGGTTKIDSATVLRDKVQVSLKEFTFTFQVVDIYIFESAAEHSPATRNYDNLMF